MFAINYKIAINENCTVFRVFSQFFVGKENQKLESKTGISCSSILVFKTAKLKIVFKNCFQIEVFQTGF
jgi:hypothetical protein